MFVDDVADEVFLCTLLCATLLEPMPTFGTRLGSYRVRRARDRKVTAATQHVVPVVVGISSRMFAKRLAKEGSGPDRKMLEATCLCMICARKACQD